MAGQPTKATDELILRLVEALKYLPIRHACDLVDIHKDTYYEWLKRAEAGDEPYATFASLARTARAEYVAQQIRTIVRAGKKNWRATAWYLERCFPDEFGRKLTQDVNFKGSMNLDLSALSDDELAFLERITAKLGAGRPGASP